MKKVTQKTQNSKHTSSYIKAQKHAVASATVAQKMATQTYASPGENDAINQSFQSTDAANKQPLENEKAERKTKPTFEEQQYAEALVREIQDDYNARAMARKNFENAWLLNIDFFLGNQYKVITSRGELEEKEKRYDWEMREVFNHIAPIVETRLAKLSRVKPTFSARPRGGDHTDVYSAKLAKALLVALAEKADLSAILSKATLWSEICGTVFYKILWNPASGDVLARNECNEICAGDVDISICSPFEIFPDSSGATTMEECTSIMHVRPYPAQWVREHYGVQVLGTDIDTLSFENAQDASHAGMGNVPRISHTIKKDHVLVIEKYEKPSKEYPDGRFIMVAGDVLLEDTCLPFAVSADGKRGFPFVKQVSNDCIGSFWGSSVVERCIPIHRAYNAVKNRKHEFLARMASGVLAVEEGSVDVELLEEEGLAPGQIVVYRAGTTIPRMLEFGDVPTDFHEEEDRLLNEFISVSGVSELMRGSSVPSGVSSGTALNLLIEQDDTRLSSTAENIRDAIVQIGKLCLRLYKQFACNQRLLRVLDDHGEVEVYYWKQSDITSEDVVLETSNELTETPTTRKNLLMELLASGVLADTDHGLSARMRARVLDALGFGIWENTLDIVQLHTKRAHEENISEGKLNPPLEIDDHDIHIEEHIKYIISGECEKTNPKKIQVLREHIEAHKRLQTQASIEASVENMPSLPTQ